MSCNCVFLKLVIGLFLAFTLSGQAVALTGAVKAEIQLKTVGNPAQIFPLEFIKDAGSEQFLFKSGATIPVVVSGGVKESDGEACYSITVTALEDVFFNFKQSVKAGESQHSNCNFILPGFWYRKNLRSPKTAPSFHTSESWLVREDRLSIPLCGAFDETSGSYHYVLRNDDIATAAHEAVNHGEVMLYGRSDLGFTGFENNDGNTWLSFGFPFREAPKTYIRKKTLAPQVTAFSELKKGETKSISWIVKKGKANDFSDFVAQMWTSSYNHFKPVPVTIDYPREIVKDTLAKYFISSYRKTEDVNYFSGVHLYTHVCGDKGIAEVGFVGRVLLNAFYAHKYAIEEDKTEFAELAKSVFDSYLINGFTPSGFFREKINMHKHTETNVLSIRRQSEGVYAMLKYLDYERKQGRNYPDWENRIVGVLDNLLKLQKENGSFARKFRDNFEIVDKTGGSTPSATVPLVMASRYFSDSKYLKSAKKSAQFLEKQLISRADYFSSTLDANCEDKEAALYASTAMYYLALATKGKEHERYVALAKKASYFTLSWYYLWDVPFVKGQLLGDLGLQSRGWGNVSVENNHIDVFIFEFVDVLNYLAKETSESNFRDFGEVITSSMLQLLPFSGHACGIAKTGYYPEVVQHTNWDYGHNGKGFYNKGFAPGWTVASLWEMLTPGSAVEFLKK